MCYLWKAKVAFKCGQAIKRLEDARNGGADSLALDPRCAENIEEILEQLNA